MSIGGDIGSIFWGLAISAFFGRYWYVAWLKHQERKMEMRMMRGESIDGRTPEVERLRQELLRLRDTSTQFDVSIDHTLQDLKDRLAAMEARSYVSKSAAIDEEREDKNILR
jgi:hypothetical protein